MTALIRSGSWSPTSELLAESRRELLQVIDEESDRLNRFIEGLSTPDTEPVPPLHLRAIEVDDSAPRRAAPRRDGDPRSPRPRRRSTSDSGRVGRRRRRSPR